MDESLVIDYENPVPRQIEVNEEWKIEVIICQCGDGVVCKVDTSASGVHIFGHIGDIRFAAVRG